MSWFKGHLMEIIRLNERLIGNEKCQAYRIGGLLGVSMCFRFAIYVSVAA